ncbi:MAG: hypothetical protein JXR94_20775 [Candidatus Hydrogenedentes bacterium]|nr:hypothetical protein [Candidatus Hydrogenedentota bacterium]
MTFLDELDSVRQTVQQEDCVLTRASFSAVRDLFIHAADDPRVDAALRRLAPDLHVNEHFLNVDVAGNPACCSDAVVEEARALCAKAPGFERWFREHQAAEGPTLLMGRWLAHLIGFRHRAIHVFLDHPVLSEYTFVQFRSLSKCGYPGCFDIAVGGHTKGAAAIEDTVATEIAEELGFDVERDIQGLVPIAVYEHIDPPARLAFRDVEYRTVMAGRLTEPALGRCRFMDGEVAALCLFLTHELQALIDTHPERIASGLLGSFPHYVAWRAAQA